jgi:hypothetical protein
MFRLSTLLFEMLLLLESLDTSELLSDEGVLLFGNSNSFLAAGIACSAYVVIPKTYKVRR